MPVLSHHEGSFEMYEACETILQHFCAVLFQEEGIGFLLTHYLHRSAVGTRGFFTLTKSA